MMRRSALGCRAAASSFARLSGGRLTQSLSRGRRAIHCDGQGLRDDGLSVVEGQVHPKRSQ